MPPVLQRKTGGIFRGTLATLFTTSHPELWRKKHTRLPSEKKH